MIKTLETDPTAKKVAMEAAHKASAGPLKNPITAQKTQDGDEGVAGRN